MIDHAPTDAADPDELDLACSSCNADLTHDARFADHRVCSACGRHYWLPARERLAGLLDPDSLQEANAELDAIGPTLRFRDPLPVADRLAEAREQPAIADAVVTGVGTIEGSPAVVIGLDLAIFGAGVGIVAGEKIALAMELAVTRRLPVIAICSSSSNRGREGVLALAQIAKLAAGAARLRRVGVPLIALLTHPTTGNVLLGLANQADICFAEPGTHAGLEGAPSATAAELLEIGAVDGVLPRQEQRAALASLLRVLAVRGHAHAPVPAAPGSDEAEMADPASVRALLDRIGGELTELRGDRAGHDHAGVIGGIGRVAELSVVVVALERTGPALDAAAFAKVNRLLRLAAHLELPVVTLVELPAGAANLDAAAALPLAQTLALLTAIPVPIVAVALGEASGLAAMTLLTGDRLLMLDSATITLAGGDQVATARDCHRLGLADTVVPEDGSGVALAAAIAAAFDVLPGTGSRRLLDDRTRRLRQLGLGTAEGRAAANLEWREWQELQQAFARSMSDVRRRWEHRQLSMPTFSARPPMPTFSMPKLTWKPPDFGELANRVAVARRLATSRSAREGSPVETEEPPDDR